MTPPLIRPWGQTHGGDLGLSVEQARNFRPTPAFQALTRSLLVSREIASEQGRSMLARSVPACRDNPNCEPDLTLLPDAVRQRLAAAERNPALYRMSLNFLAAQFMNSGDAAERESLQTQARQIARSALDRVSDPAFLPPPEDRQGRETALRTRTRMLFNIATTLSALLARPEAETYSSEDRALLREYFVRIRGSVEQLRERKRVDPQILGWPEYFDHYLQAQIALIDGQAGTAFAELLQTRRQLGELSAEAHAMPFPSQVMAGTELALQSIPRQGSGAHTEALRNLVSVEALGYVDQVDYMNSHGEGSAAEAARRSQALSLTAAAYLQAGHSSPNASGLLQHLSGPANSAALRQLLDDRLRSDGDLRRSLASIFPGDLNETSTRSRVVGEILSLAQTSAGSILSHAGENPYRSILRHDLDGRPMARAAELLRNDAALLGNLRTALGLPTDLAAESVVQELTSYGELLPTLLSSLDPALLTAEPNRNFFRELREAALGMQGDGLRLNVEQPLLDMVESLHGLAQRDEAHAAAYFAIFRSLQSLEHIGPEISLSPALRRVAGNHADELENFSGTRVIRHLTSPSSVGMMAAGIALSELAPIWLLSGARIPFIRNAEAAAAVRNSGELGILIRGGRLTGYGEAVAGLGVGLAMHLGSVGSHVVATRGTRFSEYGEELRHLGLWNLAIGTVFSMAALGGTMAIGHRLRGSLLPEAAALTPGRLILGQVGVRLGNWATGGSLMLLAHSGTAALAGHSAVPTREQAAEVFLSMALWDAGAAGLRFGVSRTRFWRQQVGSFRVEQMVQSRLAMILRRSPGLSGQRRFVEGYLRNQTRNPSDFGRIGRALEDGLVPSIEGRGENRRLIFREAPTAEVAPSSAPMTRTQAARAIMELSPEQQALVRQMLRSSAFRDSENPNGIQVVREALRDRLAEGEENPVLWVRAELHAGRNLFFEALPGEPAEAERAGTFLLDPSGKISRLICEDAVLRAVMAAYNNDSTLSSPILPPSSGGESVRSAETEAPTAAHRLPRQLPPPAEAESSAPVAEAPTAEASEPLAEPEPVRESSETDDGPEGDTAPRRPTDSLIDAARRTLPHVAEEGSGAGRPPRGDETVPFSISQAHRARRDSRPEEPAAPAAPQPPTDGTTTVALSRTESADLLQRLGPDLQPDGVRAPARATPPPLPTRTGPRPRPQSVSTPEAALEILGQDPMAAPISQPPRSTEDSEPAIPIGESDLLVLEAPATDELDFSGLVSSPPPAPETRDHTPTVIPPAPTAPRPAGPPPLPSQRQEGSPPAGRRDLSAAIRRGSTSAEPFLLLRRKIVEMEPEADQTGAVDMVGVQNYQSFAQHITRFSVRLYEAHYRTGLDQAHFEVEIAPDGAMRIIQGPEMFLREDEGFSYFSLHRRMADPEVPSQVEFLMERMHLSSDLRSMGWEAFLQGIFPPPEPSSRRSPQ